MIAPTLLLIAGALLTVITLNPLCLLVCALGWTMAKKQTETIKRWDPDDRDQRSGCGLLTILAIGAMVALLAMVAVVGEERTAGMLDGVNRGIYATCEQVRQQRLDAGRVAPEWVEKLAECGVSR